MPPSEPSSEPKNSQGSCLLVYPASYEEKIAVIKKGVRTKLDEHNLTLDLWSWEALSEHILKAWTNEIDVDAGGKLSRARLFLLLPLHYPDTWPREEDAGVAVCRYFVDTLSEFSCRGTLVIFVPQAGLAAKGPGESGPAQLAFMPTILVGQALAKLATPRRTVRRPGYLVPPDWRGQLAAYFQGLRASYWLEPLRYYARGPSRSVVSRLARLRAIGGTGAYYWAENKRRALVLPFSESCLAEDRFEAVVKFACVETAKPIEELLAAARKRSLARLRIIRPSAGQEKTQVYGVVAGASDESDSEIRDYEKHSSRELEKLTGISRSVLCEKWACEKFNGKPIRKKWRCGYYWLRAWVSVHRKT